jgi:hypothetical protein
MGAAISNVGGVTGGSAGAKEAIAGFARSAAADGSRVGGILGQLVDNMASSLKQGEQAGKAGGALSGAVGGVAKQVLQAFQSDLTRLAYIAALQKAVSKAGKPGPFNVETAINDLWVALDGVRKGNKATSVSVQSQMQRQSQMVETMSNMMKQMHDTAGAVIQNMR